MGEYAGGYAFCAVDRRWLCTVFTSNAALQRTFSTDNRRCSSVATGFHMTRSRSFGTKRPCSSRRPRCDDNSDDNPDDSCTPNNAHNSRKTVLSCLVRYCAWSWQCGV